MIAEIYQVKADLKYHTYKEFPTFDAALLCMNKLAKVLDLKFVADQTLFGGHYVDIETGESWGVR